jgi:hypothetical protein
MTSKDSKLVIDNRLLDYPMWSFLIILKKDSSSSVGGRANILTGIESRKEVRQWT